MPKPDVSDERKSQIIDASIDVFAKRGFQNTRMDDIANKAKLAKGTLYLYFKNKDEIIQHVLASMVENELTEIKNLQHADLPAKDKLLRAVDLAINDFKKFEPILPLFFEFYAYALRSKSIRKFLGTFLDAYLDALIPIIEDGIANGELKDVDPESAAISIGTIFEGTIILMIYDPKRIDLDKHMHFSAKILLEGLLN